MKIDVYNMRIGILRKRLLWGFTVVSWWGQNALSRPTKGFFRKIQS